LNGLGMSRGEPGDIDPLPAFRTSFPTPPSVRLRSMSLPANLLSDLPAQLPAELVETIVNSSSVRIERIVSTGHRSPEGFWYDQDSHEWVLLVQGSARLRFESGELIEMTAGSHVHIPAHQRHRVDWTDPQQPTVWLAVHFSR
jgi:cupin 2 domain-containing protein